MKQKRIFIFILFIIISIKIYSNEINNKIKILINFDPLYTFKIKKLIINDLDIDSNNNFKMISIGIEYSPIQVFLKILAMNNEEQNVFLTNYQIQLNYLIYKIKHKNSYFIPYFGVNFSHFFSINNEIKDNDNDFIIEPKFGLQISLFKEIIFFNLNFSTDIKNLKFQKNIHLNFGLIFGFDID